MNASHSNCINMKPAAVSRLVFLTALTLLAGCQWMPESDGWLPKHWPWHDGEERQDPRQKAVSNLIAKGDLAFTKDRLSVPANDNAVMYYRQALKMDPGSEEARDGLTHVSKRFRKLARTAHDNGESNLALKYLKLAESVSGTEDPSNQKLRRKLQATPAGQDPQALGRSLRERYSTQKNLFEENKNLQSNPLINKP